MSESSFYKLVFIVSLFLPFYGYGLEKEEILKGKSATAYISSPAGSGSAVCISESGFFVTNDHVIERSKGSPLKLVINVNEKDERIFTPEVLVRDKEYDLALLKVELKDGESLAKLDLAPADAVLTETDELVAFGYPFGRALSTQEDKFPSISVNIGRVTALRKKDGDLRYIQLDAQVNPGNSGGPVLNEKGEIAGIISSGLQGSGVNFAIPHSYVLSLVETPSVEVKVPSISYPDRSKEQTIEATVEWFQAPPEDFKASLTITEDERGKNLMPISLQEEGNGKYTAKFVPVPAQAGDSRETVGVSLEFERGGIQGQAKSIKVKVGRKSVPLHQLSLITPNAESTAQRNDGTSLKGKVTGLEKLNVDLGGETIQVDALQAQQIKITPANVVLPTFHYEFSIQSEGKKIVTKGGSISVGVPAPDSVPGITKGPELEDNREVKLPVPLVDLDTAGDGRYLVLYLRDARKLGVFDITTLKFKGYINLEEEEVQFAGGSRHLIISYPNSKTIRRYSLDTLKSERAINNTLGTIHNIAMGSSSQRYALILHKPAGSDHRDCHTTLFDVAAMTFTGNEDQSVRSGVGATNVLRASADGLLYGNSRTSVSPSGVGIIRVRDGKLSFDYHHESAGIVVPGPDSSLLFTSMHGVFTPDYAPVIKSRGNYAEGLRFAPSFHPQYFFAVSDTGRSSRSKEETSGPSIYIRGEEQPILTLKSFKEMEKKSESFGRGVSPLTIDRRYHFIPQIDLFVTIPYTNDRIFVRSVDIEKILKEKNVNYLYITSTAPTASSMEPYIYQLEAASGSGEVTFSLESGPEGMTITSDGKVNWIPPVDAKTEAVIVKLKESSGFEKFHTFRIFILP